MIDEPGRERFEAAKNNFAKADDALIRAIGRSTKFRQKVDSSYVLTGIALMGELAGKDFTGSQKLRESIQNLQKLSSKAMTELLEAAEDGILLPVKKLMFGSLISRDGYRIEYTFNSTPNCDHTPTSKSIPRIDIYQSLDVTQTMAIMEKGTPTAIYAPLGQTLNIELPTPLGFETRKISLNIATLPRTLTAAVLASESLKRRESFSLSKN